MPQLRKALGVGLIAIMTAVGCSKTASGPDRTRALEEKTLKLQDEVNTVKEQLQREQKIALETKTKLSNEVAELKQAKQTLETDLRLRTTQRDLLQNHHVGFRTQVKDLVETDESVFGKIIGEFNTPKPTAPSLSENPAVAPTTTLPIPKPIEATPTSRPKEDAGPALPPLGPQG